MTSNYVVELTPPGRAAVAVVLVAGPEAARFVGECFSPAGGRSAADLSIGRIALGRWCGVDGEELIVCRQSEDQIEIHCHGGTAAVGAIVDRMIERGCRRATWQDWLRMNVGGAASQFAAERGDATTCAAQIALAGATTTRAAGVLLDQYWGALGRAIQLAIGAIGRGDWQKSAALLDELLLFGDLGLHLTAPWRVVLAGAPNVGKSSLINALAGFERALVSPQPGTTRDLVTTITAIAGWPVQLCDTAGLRDTDDCLESAGVGLAAEALAGADLVVVVRDASCADVPPPSGANEVERIVATLPSHVRTIDVDNKIDLVPASRSSSVVKPATRRPRPNASTCEGDSDDSRAVIATSAVTSQGLPELVNAIARSLVPTNPAAGAAVPFTAGQIAGLQTARRAIDEEDSTAAESTLRSLLSGC